MEYSTVALALYPDDHHLFHTLAMATVLKDILLPIVQLLFEGSVRSAFDSRHDIMRGITN